MIAAAVIAAMTLHRRSEAAAEPAATPPLALPDAA
jgi:hypothetical protein